MRDTLTDSMRSMQSDVPSVCVYVLMEGYGDTRLYASEIAPGVRRERGGIIGSIWKECERHQLRNRRDCARGSKRRSY